MSTNALRPNDNTFKTSKLHQPLHYYNKHKQLVDSNVKGSKGENKHKAYLLQLKSSINTNNTMSIPQGTSAKSTKEVRMPKKHNTEHNLYPKTKAKTPRLSICIKSKPSFTSYPRGQHQMNTVKSTYNNNDMDLLHTFHQKADYKRTIIIDNNGNNNLNLLPKKLFSDTNLLFKLSKLKLIDKTIVMDPTPMKTQTTDFFTQEQRDEIDKIKPFNDDDNKCNYIEDDDSNNINNENEDTVSITSIISSTLNELEKTMVQDDYLVHPIYTPRQLLNKGRRVSFTQIA